MFIWFLIVGRLFHTPTDEENKGQFQQFEWDDRDERYDTTAIISVIRTRPEEATQVGRVEHLGSWTSVSICPFRTDCVWPGKGKNLRLRPSIRAWAARFGHGAN
jgi:hypothetical protein